MICTEKQYAITTEWLAKFKEALAVAIKRQPENEWAQKLEVNALKSQIAELEADLNHYDLLKSGEISVAKPHSLETLPTTLIETRITHGWSQSDLAAALNIELQQVQRYEASEYMEAGLAELIEVANVLNVHVNDLFETKVV